MSRHLGKILFILIIAVVVFFGYKVYSSSVSQFKESSDRICKVYEEMSSSVTAIPQTAKKDSVPPDITAISNVLSSGQNQISAMLHLQHAEIEEDFSTLMLWASVLMILFLVFSIYSTYRTDELVAQSRESVRQVTDLANEATKKIDEIDRLFKKESSNLTDQSIAEISKLKEASDHQLSELDKTISSKIADAEQRISDSFGQYDEAMQRRQTNILNQFAELKSFISALNDVINSQDEKD